MAEIVQFVVTSWMFTIYTGKPVGSRFVQMVSKTPEWEIPFEKACTICAVDRNLQIERVWN